MRPLGADENTRGHGAPWGMCYTGAQINLPADLPHERGAF